LYLVIGDIGTAPIGIRVSEYIPNPIMKAVNKKIISLLLRLNFIMLVNIIHQLFIKLDLYFTKGFK